MKIIDSHLHPCFTNKKLKLAAKRAGIEDFSYSGLIKEMKKNNVERAIAITLGDEKGINKIENDKRFLVFQTIYAKDIKGKISNLKKNLQDNRIGGIKILSGYDPHYPFDKKYKSVYQLAEKFDIPIIFHSGDLWELEVECKRIKYAHPLHLDEVAVDHPNMKIVIAHAGNPWIVDAAEVLLKNDNVHIDLSGWFYGYKGRIGPPPLLKIMRDRLDFIISYAGKTDKIMYGTDWPLVTMKNYIDFIKSCKLSKSVSEKIFYKNALKLFWKK